MPNAAHDTVLRLALVAMALDPTAALTPAQRAWCTALPARRTPLTPGERARLQGPLLAWVRQALPGCVTLVAQQFQR